MRRSITALLAVAIVLGAAAAGYAAFGGTGGSFQRARIEPSPVRVTGNTNNLFPGATTSLPIRVRNLTGGPVRLQWVQAIVGRPNLNCDPANLHVLKIWPAQRLPAHARIDLVMPVTLEADAGDACQGERFPLSYRTRVNVLGAGG
jgi:hypothetical protein